MQSWPRESVALRNKLTPWQREVCTSPALLRTVVLCLRLLLISRLVH
jgi:hypothetical protein